MTIVPLSTNRIEVVQDSPGQPRLLGLATGIPAKGFAARQISAAARTDAVFIENGTVRPWRIVRVVPYEEHLYLCGPFVEGITVEELLEQDPGTTDQERAVAAVLEAIAAVADDGEHRFCNVQTSLVTPEGAVLVLSTPLADEVNSYLPLLRRRAVLHPYHPSTLSPREQQVYLCGALIWRAITGSPLCTGDDETVSDACHQEARSTAAIHRIVPETREEIAGGITILLRTPGEVTPDLLYSLATRIREAGFREEIAEAERTRRIDAATETTERERRRLEGRTFLRIRGPRIALILAAVVLVGTIPFHIIRGRLTPPSIAGLPPQEVVNAYYDAWRALDHTVMDEALADGVGTDIVREVTNVFVIDRVQLAQTMESRLTPVDRWIAAGRPGNKVPYGPYALDVTVRRQDETAATIVADYELWRPAPTDSTEEDSAAAGTSPGASADGDGPPTENGSASGITTRVIVEERRDTLELTPNKWGWEISRLETTVRGTEVITVGP
ncbi:MAG: hypothetical protein ACLFR8_12780 [Alkalispirochaeta sp.]